MRSSAKTKKLYFHRLNLSLDYISASKLTEINQKILLDYFDNLKQTKRFSYSSMKQALASVRFLFIDAPNKDIDFNFFIRMKKPQNLPNILSIEEVKNLTNSITNIKHEAIISTIYSYGLRISEAVNLRIEDINSANMTVKTANSKEKNERYVVLSEKL